ncbi:hypothetical protein F0U44_13820 [Nocardioides humilatus]|uniref:Uncharacterized protein n=1 Tax=Nocardioides humilatus TaxID=2607660 RepID=A0A5B1LFG7_9ACTN|nr:hypothetical protein [Nocardioides humilatus]KAA1419501.1 hypothetical protein F0U44_13820 [Nocardioides humilatus]
MPLRSTLAGAATGVMLLGGVFGFAVGLPEWTGDEAEAPQDAKPQLGSPADLLPDTLLNGGLVPIASIDPQYQELADQVEAYGGETLAEAFGTDVAVGIYSTPDLTAQVAVTIYNGESGLFLQDGPPVPPQMSANSQSTTDVVKQGDSVCIGKWQTEAKAQNQPPFQVQCQRVIDGRTINAYAAPGISVEQAADIVDDVIRQAGLG